MNMAYTPGQAKCIETLDRSLVVAAGAGSGKTFTLTKRIVNAIKGGHVDGIHRVCAITFTNKAAGELKSRIKAELRACGLADQALAVDEAWVSTIHGMCARILRAHALELDLDPSFKMAETPLANLLRDRAIDEVLAAAQSEASNAEDAQASQYALPSRQAIDALFAEYPARSYGPRGSSVESMVRTLVEMAGARPDGFDSFVLDEPLSNPALLVDTVLDSFQGVALAASSQKPNDAREAWAAQTLEQVTQIRQQLQSGHASDAAWALQALDALEWPKKVGAADYKAQVAEAHDTYRMCAMELRLALAAPHLRTLVSLARTASQLFMAAKREEGVLDNNDLLVMAYDAVTNNPSIAALYADKFQLVMVDEFQDTDQMQVDMIKCLSGPDACRLCTVGDAQQSIYRFRGADVAVYNRHLAHIASRDAQDVIKLADNFRSHPDVLSFVDSVFGQPDVFGKSFMSLAPGRDEARVKRPFTSEVPRIQVHLTSTSYQKGASTERLREVAAQRIADAFADLRGKGHSAGQMAILLGGMAYADVYAQALRNRGIACVISGGSVFARAPEARIILDFARVIADPYQTQALHNVLTSPLFELGTQDLVELATAVDPADGQLRRENLASGLIGHAYLLNQGMVGPNWSARLVLALRVMGDAIDAVGRMAVSRIVMRALLDSGLLTRLQSQGAEGLASAANYYKVLRMMVSIESQGALGPAGVARALEATLVETKEAPGALSASGGDFVRIMTVHASKGLEFPIVAVAEFKETASISSKLLSGEVGDKVYLSLDLQNTDFRLKGKAAVKDAATVYAMLMEGRAGEDEYAQAIAQASGALERRAALFEYERAGDEEESKRLLYVALTRAKEALVVSLKGKSTKDNPLATPRGSFGAIASALAGPGEGLAVGKSLLGFGGQAPALVEHVVLAGGDSEVGEDDPVQPDEPSQSAQPAIDAGTAEEFIVPMPASHPNVNRVAYAPAHEGIFSYSSIAEAAHEGDVLQNLADRFFVSADECAEEAAFSIYLRPTDGPGDADGLGLLAAGSNRVAAVADEDDGSWAYVGSSCADSDKATDLGTAFHRLAQHAVVSRMRTGFLEKPNSRRIESLARAGNLDDVQRDRLEKALDRWFASDVASRVADMADVQAEVPFFIKLPAASAASGAFLEGEIDLLALDADRKHAVVVDYKTGGRADESTEELARKHVLQASCYAYAVMSQGAEELEAIFVRVERPRGQAPEQPQCVRYRFAAADLPVLAQSIAGAYVGARA